MTSPRDVRRELDALDGGEGGGGDPPTMLISPLTDDDPDDRPPWYYSAETEKWYTPAEVAPDEHFVMEMEMALVESSDWYDHDEVPTDE